MERWWQGEVGHKHPTQGARMLRTNLLGGVADAILGHDGACCDATRRARRRHDHLRAEGGGGGMRGTNVPGWGKTDTRPGR